ncbi:MAG: hypothetical protein ACM3X4_06360 [Ignavibacteriales bacterium]
MNQRRTGILDSLMQGGRALEVTRSILLIAGTALLAASISMSGCTRWGGQKAGDRLGEQTGSPPAGQAAPPPDTPPTVLPVHQDPAGPDVADSDPQVDSPRQKTLQEVASFEVDGEIRRAYEAEAISPGGEYVLAALSGDSGRSVVAISLDGSGGVRTLHSVDRAYLQRAAFGYYPLGWLSETRYAFAISGWQNSGPNKGKHGVAVLTGDLESGQSREVAFIPVPQGVFRSAAFERETGKAHFSVTSAIWECDVDTGETRLVKGGLPVYDGLFRCRRSPDGRYYVYELFEKGATGMFILDTETGEQKPLLPRGETWSFLPSWSPDGRYVAAYTAGLKPGATASQDPASTGNYNFLAGEDGPQPAGGSITVVDVSGRVVQTIRVEGRTLWTFRWNPSSDAIGFVAGKAVELESGLGDFEPESVWVARVGDGAGPIQPVKVVDISPTQQGQRAYVVLQWVDPDGRGMLYSDYRDPATAVWHARLDSSGAASRPAKVDDGYLRSEGDEPVFGESFLGIIEGNQRASAWLLGPGESRKIAETQGNRRLEVLGADEETLVLADVPGYEPGQKEQKSTVRVFRLVVGEDAGSPAAGLPGRQTGGLVPVRSLEIEGRIWTTNHARTLSPGGRYVLAVNDTVAGARLLAIPVNGGSVAEPRVLYSVDGHLVGHRPVGWVSDSRYIFTAQGDQFDGPHAGKRGVSIRTGDVGGGTPAEAAFIDLPEGSLLSAVLLPGKKKAYLRVTGAIWEYDHEKVSLRLVRGGLAEPDGLFKPEISPDGRYHVYDLPAQGGKAVFILENSSGVERRLFPEDGSRRFDPRWSPSGEYIAAYEVNAADENSGRLPAGDPESVAGCGCSGARQPAGGAIAIARPDGQVVRRIAVDGKVISHFSWGVDSAYIGFVAGVARKPAGATAEERWFVPDSVWVAAVEGTDPPVKVADVATGDETERWHVTVAPVEPGGRGVLFNCYSMDGSSAFYAKAGSPGAAPLQIDGVFCSWNASPVYGERIAAVVEGKDSVTVWLYGGGDAREIARFDGKRPTSITGYNGDTLVMTSSASSRSGEKSLLSVFRMAATGPACRT